MFDVSSETLSLRYSQSTGRIWLVGGKDSRALLGRGYSGSSGFVNDASAQDKVAIGPIPRGMWTVGSPINHPTLGVLCFPLAPQVAETFGRRGFYIHGDNGRGNNSASRGCIILNRSIRNLIRGLGITSLEVSE